MLENMGRCYVSLCISSYIMTQSDYVSHNHGSLSNMTDPYTARRTQIHAFLLLLLLFILLYFIRILSNS